MQRLTEFLVEYITQFDIGIHEDFGPNFSEKNYVRIKFANSLTNWSKNSWTIPELSNTSKEIQISKLLSIDSKQLNSLSGKVDQSNYILLIP